MDINGITNSQYNDRVWVLQNNIYRLGGDSIRIGQNRAGMPEPSAIPSHTYVGHNHFHDNGENAIDVKHSRDVIISQNRMHGARPSSSSSGEIVIIHERPEYVWLIGNGPEDVRGQSSRRVAPLEIEGVDVVALAMPYRQIKGTIARIRSFTRFVPASVPDPVQYA